MSKIGWYINRLRLMSVGEVFFRIKNAAQAHVQRLGLLRGGCVAPPYLSKPSRAWVGYGDNIEPRTYIEAAERVLSGDIGFFAVSNARLGRIPKWNVDVSTGIASPLVFGKTLDYRDQTLVGDVKYVWELNRHLQLPVLAQAYCLTKDARYLEGIRVQIDSWLAQCPYPQGVNWTSSLELAIRLINWSLAWQWIGGVKSPLFQGDEGEKFLHRWLAAIFQHGHFIHGHLSRFSSANNHLIGELAGLFVLTMTWPYWPACRRWQQTAERELVKEALLQNAPDGVNREQAISYQQFVLDFMLIAGLAGKANGVQFPDAYWNRMEAMLEFVASVMDVRGNVPMIGDADDGYVVRLDQGASFCPFQSLLATGAVLFERGAFKAKVVALDDKTRWLLGAQAETQFQALEPEPLPVGRSFRDGGYYILGENFETENEIRAVVDAGPLGYLSIAAHGHADALALTLSVGGREFLVDPGTYAYHTERDWRNYFRGTAAHNTVVIDGLDQSVIGGNFMWLRHAKVKCEVWQSSSEADRFVGSHDGYSRLPDPVWHRRRIDFDKAERTFAVEDEIVCRAQHVAERVWHFGEQCAVSVTKDGSITAVNGGREVRLIPGEPGLKVEVRRGSLLPIGGWVSRRFGVKAESTMVIWKSSVRGTRSLHARIEV